MAPVLQLLGVQRAGVEEDRLLAQRPYKSERKSLEESGPGLLVIFEVSEAGHFFKAVVPPADVSLLLFGETCGVVMVELLRLPQQKHAQNPRMISTVSWF